MIPFIASSGSCPISRRAAPRQPTSDRSSLRLLSSYPRAFEAAGQNEAFLEAMKDVKRIDLDKMRIPPVHPGEARVCRPGRATTGR